MKRNCLIKSAFPQTKTTQRNFGTLNLDIKRRLSFGKVRGKFTGKELDPETGLYYFGARYLDPKTSRWLSGDPAVGEYVPSAPVNDEAKKRNGNLPGQGGVFNYVNLHVYHYAGNNPVKYTDPNGRYDIEHFEKYKQQQKLLVSLVTQTKLRDNLGYNRTRSEEACLTLTLMAAVQDYTGVALSGDDVTNILDSFYASGLINGENEVQDHTGILNATLEAVGRPDLVAEWSAGGLKEGADYTVVQGKTRTRVDDDGVTRGGGTHYNLGNNRGNVIHDPWRTGTRLNDPTTNRTAGNITFSQRRDETQ